MGARILKGSLLTLLGILIDIFILIILAFLLPWIGGWIDGIPFGLFAILPWVVIGCLLGGFVGVLLGIYQVNIKSGGLLGSVIGGIVGPFMFIPQGSWSSILGGLMLVIGGVLSLIHRPKEPRKYTFALISFSIFLLNHIFQVVISLTQVITAENYQIFGSIFGIIGFVGWIFMLFALFLQPPPTASSEQTR